MPDIVEVLLVGDADGVVGADGVEEDADAVLRCLDNAALDVEGEGGVRRVSASAITKKARGERGHPWGTPHLIEKGLLRAPFALIRLVGSASGLESRRVST
eukprot:scaffold6460_cov130-Isochrysis_galbana.AAC.2